jgi:hypothetical protein
MAAPRPPAYDEPAVHTARTVYAEPATPEVIDLTDAADQHEPPTPGQQKHRLEVVEVGSFARARCGCGWDGPARRSRAVATADGELHRS